MFGYNKKDDHEYRMQSDVIDVLRKEQWNMDENLWKKVEQFLYQLHYEDTDRKSRYESQAYKEALAEQARKSSAFKAALEQLSDTDRQAMKEYLQATDQCVYEECQQAYVQGIADCMAILYGTGMLKTSQQVKEFLTGLRYQK